MLILSVLYPPESFLLYMCVSLPGNFGLLIMNKILQLVVGPLLSVVHVYSVVEEM